jgi:protein TonB
MGFSGTAIVRFRVGRSGGLESAALLRGSGVMMLDKLALRAVRQAAPFPPPPAEIGDDRLIFDVPVQFH